MANPWRGEVELVIDGKEHRMRLTLGALAELEDALKSDSLLSLVRRFEESQFTTRDVLAVLLAGLKGGGWTGRSSDLLSAHIQGGPMEAARAAALLLVRSFSLPDSGDGSA